MIHVLLAQPTQFGTQAPGAIVTQHGLHGTTPITHVNVEIHTSTIQTRVYPVLMVSIRVQPTKVLAHVQLIRPSQQIMGPTLPASVMELTNHSGVPHAYHALEFTMLLMVTAHVQTT